VNTQNFFKKTTRIMTQKHGAKVETLRYTFRGATTGDEKTKKQKKKTEHVDD